MERLAELIGKLKEQFEHKADPSQMLATTRWIEAELLKNAAARKPAGSSKIAVMMPAMRPPVQVYQQETEAPKDQIAQPKEQPVQQRQPEESPEQEPEKHQLAEEAVEAITHQQEEKHPRQTPWLYDPIHEVPTLAHQETPKDLNEIMGLKDPSLNDRLKAEIIEVGHQLTEAPIRDLKRAIGINDRFVFVNDLFRGDEVMYERSLKTINAFRIYAEAEYWIERELKVKLGWEEDHPTTRYFYQLVKRRFS